MQDRLILSTGDHDQNFLHGTSYDRARVTLREMAQRSRFPFQQGVAMATMPENRLDRGSKMSRGASDDNLDARYCP